jgi:membrane carboxypeptidase/penicillin-binding protein PbpC
MTPTIQVSPTGTQVYTASATNDCGTSTEDVTVTVNIPAVPEVTDNGLVLSSSAAASYQWYFEGDLIDDATEQQYIPMEEGNYTVETVDANGCTAVSTTTSMRSLPLSPPMPMPSASTRTQAQAVPRDPWVYCHSAIGDL